MATLNRLLYDYRACKSGSPESDPIAIKSVSDAAWAAAVARAEQHLSDDAGLSGTQI